MEINLEKELYSNVERIREGLSDKMCYWIECYGGVISGLIISFIYSWQLSLVMIAFSPVIIGGSAALSKVHL